MHFLAIILFLVYDLAGFSQSDTSRLKLVFAGDIMGHDEQITGAWNAILNNYEYEPTFRYVKPYIEQADIAVANLSNSGRSSLQGLSPSSPVPMPSPLLPVMPDLMCLSRRTTMLSTEEGRDLPER